MKAFPLCTLLLWLPLTARTVNDIPYVRREGVPVKQTSLDLYLPDAPTKKALPVFILIHGGGWSIGDKDNRTFIQPKANWLLSQGFVVASINYRLSPAVSHPAHVEDVCAAIAWVEKNIAKFGGAPDKVYLLGHSAGAHLAALAAVDRTRLKEAGADASAIRGVVLLDGAGYDIPRQMPVASKTALLGKMYRDAFTLDPEVQRDASPALKPIKNPPPFLILYVGWRIDSRNQSMLLAEALRKNGGKATVTGIPGKTHMTINADCGKPGDPVTVAIANFLGK